MSTFRESGRVYRVYEQLWFGRIVAYCNWASSWFAASRLVRTRVQSKPEDLIKSVKRFTWSSLRDYKVSE